MKLSADPSATGPRNAAESLALAKWYDANPAVQRLWAIRDAQTLRVVVSLEPTPDGDDVYPVWVANYQAWARGLQLLTGSAIQLELVDESPLDGIDVHTETTLVADLFWRDATIIPPHTVHTQVNA
jgi:hypothetical protein